MATEALHTGEDWMPVTTGWRESRVTLQLRDITKAQILSYRVYFTNKVSLKWDSLIIKLLKSPALLLPGYMDVSRDLHLLQAFPVDINNRISSACKSHVLQGYRLNAYILFRDFYSPLFKWLVFSLISYFFVKPQTWIALRTLWIEPWIHYIVFHSFPLAGVLLKDRLYDVTLHVT